MSPGAFEPDQRIAAIVSQRLSQFFIKARRKSGLGIEDVKAATGIDLGPIEEGTSDFPLGEIERLAQVYGVPTLNLVDLLTDIQIEIQKAKAAP